MGPNLGYVTCRGARKRGARPLSSSHGLREAGGVWSNLWAPSIVEPRSLTTAMVPAAFPLPRAANALPGPRSWPQAAGAVPEKLQHSGPYRRGYGAGVQPLRGRGLSPAAEGPVTEGTLNSVPHRRPRPRRPEPAGTPWRPSAFPGAPSSGHGGRRRLSRLPSASPRPRYTFDPVRPGGGARNQI